MSVTAGAVEAGPYRGYTSDDYDRAVASYYGDRYGERAYGERYTGRDDGYARKTYHSGPSRTYSHARCEETRWSNDELLGTALGAVLGGVIGNQFGKGRGKDAATIAGVFIGGFAGNRLAHNMSCRDQRYAQETYYRAYEYGHPGERYSWHNPEDRSHYGYVTPSDWYEDDYGRRCREYTQTIYIEGRRQTATGTACRNPDGTWRIVS